MNPNSNNSFAQNNSGTPGAFGAGNQVHSNNGLPAPLAGNRVGSAQPQPQPMQPTEYAPASPIIPAQQRAGNRSLTSVSPFASNYDIEPAQPVPLPVQRRVGAPRRRRGCSPLSSCRNLGCLLSLLILGFLVFVAYLVIVRPPHLWEPVKTWLNGDLEPVQTQQLGSSQVFGQLNDQVGDFDIGDNDLQVTEPQFKVLFDSALKSAFPGEVYTDVQKDLLRIYWNIDASSSVPLWSVIEFGVNAQGQLELTKIGAHRLPFPAFLNQAVSNFALSAMRIGRQQQTSDLLGALIPLPENVTLKKVQLLDDKMLITLTVKNGLDGLFQ